MDQAAEQIVTRAEYLIFVFTAALGILQLVALRTRLKGLLFVRNRLLTYLLSIGLIVFAYYWFFVRDDRIDTVMRHVGLEGSGQFYNFCMGVFSALLVTLAISSLIGHFTHRGHSEEVENESVEGLDRLEKMTYWEAVKCSFRKKDRYR